jgi:hypothetical protein
MKINKIDMFKVFVGACDTYEVDDYAFIGSWDECIDYINKYNHQKQSYVEPAGYSRTEAVAGLCEGRHEIPDVDDYIFGEIENPMDFADLEYRAFTWVDAAEKNDVDLVILYVTGFTPALTSVIKACSNRHISLKLMHYDRETNTYKAQYVLYA